MLGDVLVNDNTWTTLVLEVVGLMCDGQHRTLQNYLRDQPDNFKVKRFYCLYLFSPALSISVTNSNKIYIVYHFIIGYSIHNMLLINTNHFLFSPADSECCCRSHQLFTYLCQLPVK